MTYQELADRIHAIEMTVEKAHEALTELLVAVEKMETAEEEAKAETPDKPKAETKPLKLEDVRAALTALASEKGAATVKQLLKDWGAEKLSDIAAQDYPELLAKAKEMGQ